MKKVLTLLLALTVILGLTLVAVGCACDEEEADATTTTAAAGTTTTAADDTPTVLTPGEAKVKGAAIVDAYIAAGEPDDRTGYSLEDVTVAGTVYAISDKSDKWIVSIGTAEEGFSLCVYKDDMAAMGLTDAMVALWMDADVEVTGDIELNTWGHMAEMVISDIAQVTVK